MSNIIKFSHAKLKHFIRKYDRTGYADEYIIKSQVNSGPDLKEKVENIVHYQIRQHKINFIIDVKFIEDSFKTESALFKFPTIQSKYKRTTNPVRALYNEVQRILFIFDRTNNEHLWVIGLLKDEIFYTKLISAINQDIISLTWLINKWDKCAFTSSNNLEVYKKLKDNLEHYKEVFKIVKEIDFEEFV